MEPSAEGQQGWLDLLAGSARGSGEGGGFLAQCTPGYYNSEGATSNNTFLGAYTAGLNSFSRLLEEWREAGDMDGMELTTRP